MSDDVIEKTKKTAALYFEGVQDEGPYALWKAFDANWPRICRSLSPAACTPGKSCPIRPANWSPWRR